MMHYYNFGYYPFGFPNIITIIIWAGIIILIVALFSRSHKDSEPVTKDKEEKAKSYLDIIKERYARGEIKKNEYEQLKKDLG